MGQKYIYWETVFAKKIVLAVKKNFVDFRMIFEENQWRKPLSCSLSLYCAYGYANSLGRAFSGLKRHGNFPVTTAFRAYD